MNLGITPFLATYYDLVEVLEVIPLAVAGQWMKGHSHLPPAPPNYRIRLIMNQTTITSKVPVRNTCPYPWGPNHQAHQIKGKMVFHYIFIHQLRYLRTLLPAPYTGQTMPLGQSAKEFSQHQQAKPQVLMFLKLMPNICCSYGPTLTIMIVTDVSDIKSAQTH
jgi:hypothetical protein